MLASEIKTGVVYEVRHSRKGTFNMRVDSIDGEWVSGVVVKGFAGAMMSYNVKEEGDKITIRDSHSYFIPVKGSQ